MINSDLTIIVLTYNSSHIISDCLSNLNFKKYEVIVVDNKSSDNTLEVVKKNFPSAKIIANEKNIGFGRANNVALNQVKTPFALVLNPDAIIKEQDIEIILSEMKRDEKVAIAGPLVLQKYPLDQNELDLKLSSAKKDLNSIKDNFRSCVGNVYEVRFIIGCAMFLNMSIFRKIGFFDENFFLYYEDDEICLRTNRNGFKNIILNNALAFHLEGQSSNIKPSFKSVFRKSWHLKGFSKLYWKEIQKGKLRAIRSALKVFLVSFVCGIIDALKLNNEKCAISFGTSFGALSYLLGLTAFKKDGTSRV